MARRKRSKKKGNDAVNFLLLLFLLGAGGMTGWNGCSETDNPDHTGNTENTGKPGANHYPDLETVSIPKGLTSQIKEYTGFTVSFNKDNGTPNYVAWELLGKEVANDVQRDDNFWTDPDIDGCPSTKDYTRSGYDRGHMCPAADQKWSAQAMYDCFAIMIIAGPLYDKNDTKRIGDAGVRVPGAFFKVLMAPYLDQPRGIAFVYPNMTSPGNMQDYAMSIDELEEILGYDFFPTLPDNI